MNNCKYTLKTWLKCMWLSLTYLTLLLCHYLSTAIPCLGVTVYTKYLSEIDWLRKRSFRFAFVYSTSNVSPCKSRALRVRSHRRQLPISILKELVVYVYLTFKRMSFCIFLVLDSFDFYLIVTELVSWNACLKPSIKIFITNIVIIINIMSIIRPLLDL